MDILWMRHLAAPAKPGIYTLEDGSAQILVRGKDIEASKRLEGHEIHCVCVGDILGRGGHSRLGNPLDDEAYNGGPHPGHFR